MGLCMTERQAYQSQSSNGAVSDERVLLKGDKYSLEYFSHDTSVL